MPIIAKFVLEKDHYKRALKDVKQNDSCEYYSTHCAMSSAGSDSGLKISVNGTSIIHKRSHYRMSSPVYSMMFAFDLISRDAPRLGDYYMLSMLTPSNLPATIVLVKYGIKRLAVLQGEFPEGEKP